MLAALSAAAYDTKLVTRAYQSLGFTDDFKTTYYTGFDPNLCSYSIGYKDSVYNNDKI